MSHYDLTVSPHDEEGLYYQAPNDIVNRHYGPGPHPGTGTEQTVHGGGRQVRPETSGLGEHRFGSPLDRNTVIFRFDPRWSEKIEETPEEHGRKFHEEVEEALVEMEMALGFPISGLTITNDLLELAVKRRGPAVKDNPSLRETMMGRLFEQSRRWLGAYNKGLIWLDTTPEVSESRSMDSQEFHENLWHEVGHYLTHWDGKSGLSPGWVMSMNDLDYIVPSNTYIKNLLPYYGAESKIVFDEHRADLVASYVLNQTMRSDQDARWVRSYLGLSAMNDEDQKNMRGIVGDLREEMKLKHPDLFKEELLEERAEKEPRTVLVAFPKAGEIVSVSPETAQELQDSDAIILFPFEK